MEIFFYTCALFGCYLLGHKIGYNAAKKLIIYVRDAEPLDDGDFEDEEDDIHGHVLTTEEIEEDEQDGIYDSEAWKKR